MDTLGEMLRKVLIDEQQADLAAARAQLAEAVDHLRHALACHHGNWLRTINGRVEWAPCLECDVSWRFLAAQEPRPATTSQEGER